MSKGVIEFESIGWVKSAYSSLNEFLFDLLQVPADFHLMYRYREGNRAVILWPEERMGEVVEL